MARPKKVVKLTRQMLLTAKALDDESKKRREGPVTKEYLSDAMKIPMDTASDLRALLTYGKFLTSSNDSHTTASTMLVLSDIHIPHHDPEALEVALSYGEQIKVDSIMLLGDIMDCYKVSRFTKDPRQKGMLQEIGETVAFLGDVRKRFPKAKIYYYRGNHEKRVEDYICNSAPEIFDLIGNLLQNQLMFHELDIEYLTEPTRIGKLLFLHGHEKPGGFTPVNVPEAIFRLTNTSSLCGHFHVNQTKIFKNYDGDRFWVGAVGYLAGPQGYMPLNRWTSGFAVVNFDEQGRFRAAVHEIIEGGVF